MDVLVIGGNGQLGRHLREEFPGAAFWDRKIIDLADLKSLSQMLAEARPHVIVNAAAYTAVDRAESERELAWRINAEVPAELARAAQRLSIPLLHVSTDYVFDGTKAQGYVESDAVSPLNAYGVSKLGGELAVASLCERHWILRTSWVFSEYGNNFPKTMLRLAQEREELRVVDDQHGRPTYAGDLARCVAGLVASIRIGPALPWGVHHVGGGPLVNWKQFAEATLSRAFVRGMVARLPRVIGISTEQYPTPAARPRSSLLLTRSEFSAVVSGPFDWERGLDTMLARLPVCGVGAR